LSILSQRQYDVHQQIDLVNTGASAPEKQNLWVALIRTFPPYQVVTSMSISPKTYTLVTDELGNQYAEFDFSRQPPGAARAISIDYQVTVNEVAYDLSTCQGPLPEGDTQPELHIESANPQIVSLAQRLAQPKSTPCDAFRAFYNYVGDNLTYTPNNESWGAQAALGPMGADCTEYSSLLIALSRAQHIPARYFEGLRYLTSDAQPDDRIQHAWVDVFLPGAGWVAMDPTLGRLPTRRSDYFAHYTPDHIIVTMGRNPSTLRGSNYWTHLYWPGDATTIVVEPAPWKIEIASGSD
jgi:transglutaminase-like putative cysteine protease